MAHSTRCAMQALVPWRLCFLLFTIIAWSGVEPANASTAECLDSWCWNATFGDTTHLVSSLSYTRAAAVSFCSSKNATLAAPTAAARAALVAAGLGSGWSAAVGTETGLTLRDGPNGTSYLDDLGTLWQPPLGEPVVMYDCLTLTNTSANIGSVNCSTASQPAICARSVVPAAWVAHSTFGLSYGIYDVDLARPEAVSFCENLGLKAHLAFIPQHNQTEILQLLRSVRHQDSPSRVWIGHDPNIENRHGKFWTEMFTYGALWDPTNLGWKSADVCTSWNVSDGVFTNSTRSTKGAVICSRFAAPTTREYCFPGTSTNLAYQFLPLRLNSPADAASNFTMATATAACTAAGGELVKFRNATELYDCFPRAAVYTLITAYRSSSWTDGSSEPIPQAIASINSAGCTYSVSNATSPLDSGVAVDCTATKLPAVCQFDTTGATKFTASPSAITMAENCAAHIDVVLDHGIHPGASYRVCAQSMPAGLEFATCAFFGPENATRPGRLQLKPSVTSGSATLTLQAQCNPSSACSGVPTVGVTLNYGPRSSVRIGVAGATPSASLPRTGAPVAVGSVVPVAMFVPGVSVGGSVVNLTLGSAVEADGCRIIPDFFTTSTSSRTDTVNVTCSYIQNVSATEATFTLLGTFTTGDATGCHAGYSTTSGNGVPVALATFVFTRAKTATVAQSVDVPFYPFGNTTAVPVALSALPSTGLSLRSYVCVGAMSVTDSNVVVTPSCLTSESTTSTLQVTFANNDFAGMGDFNATLQLYGPAATEYATRFIDVRFKLQSFEILVNDTNAVEYVAANISVRLDIPYLVPAGQQLAAQVNPGLENPTQCPDLNPQFMPTSAFNSVTSYTMQFYPPTVQCIQSGSYTIVLAGGVSRFFVIRMVSPRNFTIREGQPIGFSPRLENLFLGAAPVKINVSLPLAFTDSSGAFGLQLYFAGRTTSNILSSSDMVVNFAAGGPQKYVIEWTGQTAGPGVPVSFAATPGSTAQFTLPQPFAVSVIARTNVTVSVLVEPFYFAEAWYRASVTFERPPLTAASYLTVALSHPSIESQPLNITSSYPTLSGSFLFKVVGVSSGVLSPAVVLHGPAAAGYMLTHSTVTLPPLTSQLTVSMAAPDFMLASDTVGATCADCTATFSLSHAVRSSERVVVTISTTATLNVSSRELVWTLGTQGPQTVQLTPLGPDENAGINFTVQSFRRGTERNNEANTTQESPQTHAVVVRQTGNIGISGWIDGDRSATGDEYDLVVDRVVWMNFTATQSPSPGTVLRVTPVVNVQPADTVAIEPSNATFTSTSPRWVAIRYTGSKSYPGSPARITFQLDGTGVSQYDAVSGSYQLTVKPRDPIVCDLPSIVVAGSSPVPIVFQVSTLPTFELNVTMRAIPDVIAFDPVQVLWNQTTAKQRTVLISAAQPYDNPVQIIAEPPARSGFVGFSSTLMAAPPSNITVTFPTERVYVQEAASIQIGLGNPVVGATSLRIVGTTVNCGSCTNDPALNFAGALTTRQFSVYFNPSLTITNPVTIEVTLTVDQTSSASDQYRFETRYSGFVTFLPLRTVHVVDFPRPFYVGSGGAIKLSLSELPDEGSWMSVRDDAGLSTTTAMWNGVPNSSSVPAGNRSLNIQFLRPGEFNVSFLVTASSQIQRNRYITAPMITVEAVRKLEVSVADQLRPSQVTGDENNQTIRLVASRAPNEGHPVNVTPVFFSPLGDIVRVVPPVVTFNSSDSGAQLIRTVSIVGTRRGEITNLRLKLESTLPAELIAAETASFANSLIFEAKKIISFSGSSTSAYVDGRTDRAINVSIDSAGYFGVTVNVSYSHPGAVRFLSSRLRFSPGGALWQLANFTCEEPAIDGAVKVELVSGSEFSELVNGQVTFSIFPRITPTVIVEQQEITATDTVQLRTDIATSVSVEVDAFQGVAGSDNEAPVVYGLRLHRVNPVSAASFVELDPPELNFTRLARRRSFNVLTGALEPFAFAVEVISPTDRRFAPPFNITMMTNVSVRVGVTSFPQTVFVGEDNAAVFRVHPLIPVPARTFLQLRVQQSCGGEVSSVAPLAALDWNAGSMLAVDTKITGVSPGSCQLQIMRANSNIRPSVSTYVEASYRVIERPRAEWSNLTRLYEEPYVRYRTVRDFATDLLVQTFDSGPAVLQETLNFTVLGPNEEATAPTSFIVRTNKDAVQEPLGVLAQYRAGHQSLLRLSLSDARRGMVVFTLGPCDTLLELEGESLTISATEHAFAGVSPMQSNRSMRIDIGRYVANLVEEDDIISTTVVSGLATMASVGYAAPYSMQPSRANAFMWLLDCPDPDWKTRQYRSLNLFTFTPDTVKFSSYENLGRWLMIALTNSGAMLAIAGIHAFIAASWFIQRKRGSKRTFTETCGRLHFPGLTLVVCLAWLLETTTAATRVMLYSPNSDFRVWGGLLLIPFVVVIPYSLWKLLWNNSSLRYTESQSRQSWKNFLVFRVMRPEGEWSHPSSPSFVARYGVLFTEMRANHRFFLLFEYACTIIYAVLSAVEPTAHRGCVAKAGCMTAVLAVQLLAIIAWRPYVREFTNFIFGLAYGFQFIALTIITSELARRIRNDRLQRSAVALLIAGAAFQLAGGIWFLLFSVVQCFRTPKKRKTDSDDDDEEHDVDKPDGGDHKKGPLVFRERGGLESHLLGGPAPATAKGAERGGDYDDRSDDEIDADAQRAADMVEQRSIQPRGMFRSQASTHGVSYSPLRAQSMDHQRALAREPPRPSAVIFESSDEEIEHGEHHQPGVLNVPSRVSADALYAGSRDPPMGGPGQQQLDAPPIAEEQGDDPTAVRRIPCRFASGVPAGSPGQGRAGAGATAIDLSQL